MTEDATPPYDVTDVRLCAIDDVPDGGVFECVATVDGDAESVLVLRRGETVRAFFNVCPHAGRRLDFAPGRFIIDGGLVVCAAHGATFAIPDGTCVAGPCRGDRLRDVPVQVHDRAVWLARA